MIDSSPVRCLPSSCQIDRTSIRVRPEADVSFVSAFLPAKAKEKAVGSATTLSSMMLFRSHSSRQRKVSLMTDQPMVWLLLYGLTENPSDRVSPCVTIFLSNFIIDRVRHSIHLYISFIWSS